MSIIEGGTDSVRADLVVTGAQIRGARGLLNMSVSELAERTGLAINTIRKAEKTNGHPEVTSGNLRLIVATLEQGGVVFIPADTLGPGARLQSADAEPLQRRRDKVAR